MKCLKLQILSLFFGAIIILLSVLPVCASEPEAENSPPISSHLQKKSEFEELKPDIIYSRHLNGREKHFFTVRADGGKCLRFLIEQNGIDVMIAVRDAKENAVKKVDRPNGAFGRETVTFIVPHTNIYTIEIEAWRKDAVIGKYEISYVSADSPSDADHARDLAENLTSEAEILRSRGLKENKEKALQKFVEALSIWQSAGDVYEQAVVYYGIGYTNYELSNYYEAARFYNRALKLHLEIKNEAGQATNHAALGVVEYALNENDFAFYNIQKAIEIYKNLGNVRGLGIAFHALGTAQFLAERNDSALASLAESLRWRGLANDVRGKARTHISRGEVYLRLKIYEKAGREFHEARKTMGEERASNDAELLYNFGCFFLATGNLNTAEKNLARSLALYREEGNKTGKARVLFALSRVSAQTGETKKSLEYIKTALVLIEHARLAVLDYRRRIKFFESVQPFYEYKVALLMKMHELEPEKGFDRKALEISEQSRARTLLDRLERRSLIKQGKIRPELLEHEQRLRDELTETLARYKNADSMQTAAAIQEISSRFIELGSEVNRQINLPETISPPTLTIEKIQKLLYKNTILLEYALNGNDAFLWLVSDAKVKSFRLAAGEKIESRARAVFDCISKSIPAAANFICRRKINLLSETLLRGVAKDIQNKRLIIVKHGFLQYIPFAVLVNPATHDYLIRNGEIVNLPSASVLSFTKQINPAEMPPKTLKIFGDPIFSSFDGRLGEKTETAGKISAIDNSENLPRLFASNFEVERVSAPVAPEKLSIKTGAAANRQKIFDANLKDYRILHFATHALTDDREPELSAIVLSLFDENGQAVNGFLRSNDILRFDLNADLVVLSACRSGSGKQFTGEGITSLANSFFAAGARGLLVSLWNVDDKVTAELMARFYHKYLQENKSPALSLRESQIEIMRDKRWSSPFYWAAFVLQTE